MGYTYKKEKSFDDRNSKKRMTAEIQRKQNKHNKVRDVLYEDGDDIEFDDFEEYYEPRTVQHNRQK